MRVDFSAKNALVCGSSQGIGWAVARQLAKSGATVTLVARNEERLAERRLELESLTSRRHFAVSADFSRVAEVEAALERHMNGHPGYHILINNTGGAAPGPITAARSEHFLAAFEQHLLVNHTLATLVLPGMRSYGYGRIVNIVSTSVREPLPGLGVSNTIRGSVAAWAKTLSREVAADGITVNNVLPGATATARLDAIIEKKAAILGSREEAEKEMTSEIPAGRFATADEIAAAVVFLASDKAGYITGVSLPVDGGRLRSL
jgi:3-oxoacyl-[acyl-carrier protein] reductase